VNKTVFEDLGLIQKRDKGTGYFDRFRDRIIFPFYNVSGRIIGFGGRRLNENDNPKYLNSPESKVYKKGELLYGLYQAIPSIREKRAVILVEGYFDLLRLVDSDIHNVIASSGTALTEAQGRLIKRYTNTVIIAYDSDKAGLQAAIRNSQILETVDLSVSMVLIPPPHDPDTIILEEGKAAFVELLKNRVSPIDYRLKILQQESKEMPLEAKNELIDNLLEEYAQIPNEVKIGLYIHKIAERMEVAESFLIDRFNKIKKRDSYRISRTDDEKQDAIPTVKKGQWRAEEDLIAILLLDQNEVSKYIFDHISTADFTNDNLRGIFEVLAHQWEEQGHLELKEIERSLPNPEDMELITKLSLQTLNKPLKYAAGCIYKMRKWYFDSRYNEILRLMREEDASTTSKMHYTKELTEIRKRLSEIEKEQIKFYKADL
ncbi:MAG: toprim domain-containing protein, partial [Calditrichales bacterium]